MTWPHLFEFMDQDWLPGSLRATLREILECGNSAPFRPYYSWVADEVLRATYEDGLKRIVELGAGTAPVTRHMVRDTRSEGLQFVVCDSNPDRAAYEALENEHPGKIFPIYEPVDFSQQQSMAPKTLFFLSATLHHIPSAARPLVLNALTKSASKVLIFEPLRKTLLSLLFVVPSIVPAIVLPLWFLRRPGRLRRFLWCWLLPIAPLMFWWDGWISCLRQWSDAEWNNTLLKCDYRVKVDHRLFCQIISCQRGEDTDEISRSPQLTASK